MSSERSSTTKSQRSRPSEKSSKSADWLRKTGFRKPANRQRPFATRTIVPLLNGLREDFAAEKRKILPTWLVHSDGKTDEFFGSATTPDGSATGVLLPSFTIKAVVAVAEAGGSLAFSVACSCADPEESSTFRKHTSLHEAKMSVEMPTFNEMASREWFQDQLAKCAEKCVREKMVPKK